jgi:multidrug efflux pump subunit AcrB
MSKKEEKPQPEKDAEEAQRDKDQDWYQQVCQTITKTLRWLIIGVVVVLIFLILAVTGGIPEGTWSIFSALGPLFGG